MLIPLQAGFTMEYFTSIQYHMSSYRNNWEFSYHKPSYLTHIVDTYEDKRIRYGGKITDSYFQDSLLATSGGVDSARSGESGDSRYAETRKNIKFSSSAPVKCDSERELWYEYFERQYADIQSSRCQNEAPVLSHGKWVEIRSHDTLG